MIKYDNNNINDWNFGDDNIAKVYYGVTESSRLPNGYTEVEYISNYSGGTATPTSTTKNGLAYIDTNFIPTEKTRTVADLQITQASQNPRYFGSGKWNSLGYIVSQEWTVGESRARIYCKYGQSSEWIQTDYVPTMDRHVYDLNNDGKLLIDNVEIATLPTTSFTCATSMAIFTATRANDAYVDLGETVFGRCYSFKIYEDGILVRDFVPCTRDSDSKAGMYDIVNDVFYSSGNNNNLYAGNALPTSTVGNVVYQKIVTGGTPPSSGLPSGYTEVEYVENTGTSYINTNFVPNQDTRILCTMQCVTSTNSTLHFGAGGWDKADGMWLTYETGVYGTLHISWGNKTSWSIYNNVTGNYNVHTYDWNKNELYRDNTLVGSVTYANFTCSDNLGIFTTIQNGTAQTDVILKGKLFSFKIYDNGTLVRDFVPCIRDNDNMVGLYDLVNNVFYYPPNYSSYQLVAGPTV